MPADRENFGSDNAPWQAAVGYSRTVRAGSLVFVAGTVPISDDGAVIGDGAYEQTRAALAKVEAALGDAGAKLADVVQTRLFVTDIARWEDYGRAHGEVFGDVRPVSSMVEVSALIDPRLLVEIEAIAVLPSH
jgi:enamine deaminase RidA (YjgF/YER057c/UK114 family)